MFNPGTFSLTAGRCVWGGVGGRFNHRSLNVCGAPYPNGPPYHICRWVSFSSDMGLSWHGFRSAPELPDPGAKGGIAAWPKHKALLFTNNAESTVGMRVNITLRASFDDGKSSRIDLNARGSPAAKRANRTHTFLL